MDSDLLHFKRLVVSSTTHLVVSVSAILMSVPISHSSESGWSGQSGAGQAEQSGLFELVGQSESGAGQVGQSGVAPIVLQETI